jgi:hypothetical protein
MNNRARFRGSFPAGLPSGLALVRAAAATLSRQSALKFFAPYGPRLAQLNASGTKGKRKLDRDDAEKHHRRGKEPCRPSFISYKGPSW